MKKQKSSTYLVAKYLLDNGKGKICDMKKCCKANNIPERVRQLRYTHGWDIKNKELGCVDGVRICEYEVIKQGNMPKMYK